MSHFRPAGVEVRSLLLLIAGLLLAACAGPGNAWGQSPDPDIVPAVPLVEATPEVQNDAPAPTASTTATAPSPTPSPTPEPRRISWPPGEIVRGNMERREMALTFDCGASAVPTPAILDALRAHGIRATFFLTGQWVQQNPDLSRLIASEHELANHSFSHPDFATLTDAQIVSEMERAERIIQETTGHSTYPFWRPPFGSRNARILRVVAKAGWPYEIYWTADSGDWREITPQQVRANINAAAVNGAIIVQHCGSTQTAVILGQVIADLQAQGFRLTTVSDLIRD